MRDFIPPTYYRLPTPQGDLLAWSNGAGHVGVRTEHAHNRSERNAPEGGWDGVLETITVNRVDYFLHQHYHVKDGALATPYDNFGSAIRRAEAFSLDNGSESARRKSEAMVSAAVSEWLTTDTGRAALAEGERARINNDLLTLEGEISEAEDALRDLRERRDSLLAAEHAL